MREHDVEGLRPKSMAELQAEEFVMLTNARLCYDEMKAIRDILYPLYEGQHEPLATMRDIAALAAEEIRVARKQNLDTEPEAML